MVLFEDGLRDRSRVKERASASTDAHIHARGSYEFLFEAGDRGRSRVLPMGYANKHASSTL